ncbi:ribonuclease HII [Microbacterium sp. NPDC077184]|uniref:ribonuclease HII n=1 Tax=Microbacterium sp. NPDC077184 TaxID=3154764 RepID=UPI00341558DC
MTVVEPRLCLERRLLKEFPILVACDEVGRGALAGPVAVGAVAIDAADARRRVPTGLRDSKLVRPVHRVDVARRAGDWVRASAVGWASAAEIDEIGIMRAMSLATSRALADLRAHGTSVDDAVVLLDGNYDYVSLTPGSAARVRTQVKADRDCASAAAASVIAKVARDALMVSMHEDAPLYGWDENKGYASATHRAALRAHGASVHHRRSWSLGDGPTLF